MILKALYDYYNRCADLAPEGLEHKEIGFLIVISPEGEFQSIEDCRIDKKTCKSYLVSKTVQRSGSKAGTLPCLLWDNASFVIGALKDGKPNPDGQYLDSFRGMVQTLMEKHPNNNRITAVSKFYQKHITDGNSPILLQHDLYQDLLETKKNISFRILGDTKIVAEDPDVLSECTKQTDDVDNSEICLVTGKRGTIARIHSKTPLPGSTFTSLVSFQKGSGFDSYGKQQALNAPVSEEAMFAYTTALNTMLARDSRNKFTIGGRTFLFWASSNSETCKEVEESLFDFLGFTDAKKDDPNARVEQVRKVFKSIYSSVLHTTSDDKFYILGLAPNSARIAVVFWNECPLREFAGIIVKHFEDMEITDSRNDKKPYQGLYQMLSAVTLGGKSSDVQPNLPEAVVKSIMQGIQYPASLYQACIRRIRAEQQFTIGRAAIIKAYLNRLNDNNKKIEIMLDKENTNPGYLCGRLFAALERIQEKANSIHTIRERYLNAASATPSAVFATLLNLSVHHLEKMNVGQQIFFEKLKQEILDKIPADGFPAHLELQDQGRFFVGYYHQRQDFFTSKETKNAGIDEETQNDK